MSSYKVQSKQTKYYLVSDGTEKPGEEVKTIPADDVKDPKSIVVFIEPPVNTNVLATVRGNAGYYAAPPDDDPRTGQFVTWREEPYQWHVNQGIYTTIHVPNQDLYWYDKFNVGIGRRFRLDPGRDALEEENHFIIESVE